MIRKLVDYKKLDHTLAALLIETYPYGYGDDDIITFRNGSGEIVEAVELKTEDTIYMVKISKSLASFISNFEENIEKELEDKSEDSVLEKVDSQEARNNFGSDFESDEEGDFE